MSNDRLRSEILHIASDLPVGDKTRRELLSTIKVGADIIVDDAEIDSGQAPGLDNFDDEFATGVDVTFTVSGKLLARMFGKQQRVLVRFLEKLDSNKALRIMESGRSGAEKEIYKAVSRAAKQAVVDYVTDEFEDRYPTKMAVEISEGQHIWSARIDPRREQVTFKDVAYDVVGAWEWLD